MEDRCKTKISSQGVSMHLLAFLPEGLMWCAAGAVGAVALTALARVIEDALDLEAH
jgi:hypothetical protein